MKRSHWKSLVTWRSRCQRPSLALIVYIVVCFSFNWPVLAQETIPDGSLFANQGLQTVADGHVPGSGASDAQPAIDGYETETSQPLFGFANGFVLASPNMKSIQRRNYPFSTRLSGWMQLRHAIFESNGPNRDRNAFSLERIRVGIDGHAYSPDLQYTFVLDANSDQAVQVSFLDAFVNYDFGRNLFNLDANQLGFRLGKWKSPFSRSREESARRFQFTERSVANLFFDIGRATGVSLYGGNNLFAVPSHFEIALINGINTGRDAAVSADDLDQNFGWSARASVDPLGQFDDGESDLAWSPESGWRLGAGAAGSQVDREGAREFDRPRVVASGQPLVNLLPNTINSYNFFLFTVDSHWKVRGFSLIAEYHWRSLSEFIGGNVPNLTDNGLVLQTGYFLVPRRLEAIARWSKVVGNSGTLGADYQRTNEIGTGFVWFIKNQDVKLTTDLSWIDGVPVNSPRLSLLPGDEGWLLRSQVQVGF